MIKTHWKAGPFFMFICAEMPKDPLWVWLLRMMSGGSASIPGEGCAALPAQLPALPAKLNSGKTVLGSLKQELKAAELGGRGWLLGPSPCGVGGAPAVPWPGCALPGQRVLSDCPWGLLAVGQSPCSGCSSKRYCGFVGGLEDGVRQRNKKLASST